MSSLKKIEDAITKLGDDLKGEIKEINENLFDPDEGVFARIKEVDNEVKKNAKFRRSAYKLGWIFVSAMATGLVAIGVKLIFL